MIKRMAITMVTAKSKAKGAKRGAKKGNFP
jgi:hypothetical protein